MCLRTGGPSESCPAQPQQEQALAPDQARKMRCDLNAQACALGASGIGLTPKASGAGTEVGVDLTGQLSDFTGCACSCASLTLNW